MDRNAVEPVPTTKKAAAKAFRCHTHRCQLGGPSCAERHIRKKYNFRFGRPRKRKTAKTAKEAGVTFMGEAYEDPCAVCSAGAARAELLGVTLETLLCTIKERAARLRRRPKRRKGLGS